MKNLIIICILFLCTVAVSAQSSDVNDYAPVTVNKGKYFAVDLTSIERVSTGNIVFWAVSVEQKSSILVYLSAEVNCVTKKIRFRRGIATNGKVSYTNSQVTNWMPRTDKVGNQLIIFVCK